MAVGLILEFDGVGREQYEAVNERLGIDPATGLGEWPDGLLFHAGGAKRAAGWSWKSGTPSKLRAASWRTGWAKRSRRAASLGHRAGWNG